MKTAMKRLWLLPVAAVLSACTGISNSQFQGESLAFGGDNILRGDVIRVIQLWEKGAFSCQKIDGVNAKIMDVKRPLGRVQAQEMWTIHACGGTHQYSISLREDARGETDFSVSLIPQ